MKWEKIKKCILHPGRIIKQIEWCACKRRFRSIGKDAKIGMNFSIIAPENISIGDHFTGGDNVGLWTWESSADEKKPCLIIGDHVSITTDCVVTCANHIEIGSGALLGRGTLITDNSHGCNMTLDELQIPPAQRKIWSKGSVRIGENVWTGKNVCIMPGVTIGKGVIIGANSVVTHDIPDYCVAAGIPAKIIKKIKG